MSVLEIFFCSFCLLIAEVNDVQCRSGCLCSQKKIRVKTKAFSQNA